MNSNITLPIYNLAEMNTYLWYSLKLCILDKRNYESWYNQHFIQLYTYDKKNYLWKLDYEDRENRDLIFDAVIETCTYNKASVDSDIIIDSINCHLVSGYYSIVELDEYYIPAKALFMSKHFIHPVLIYGTNLVDKSFKCIGFDKNNIFGQLEVKYSDFIIAIKSSKDIISSKAILFSLLKPKTTQIVYSPQTIQEAVEHYLAGKPIYENKIEKRVNPYYGINTYSAIIECLQQNIFDYRVFHLYAEQKRELQKKLLYFYNHEDLKDKTLFATIIDFKNEVALSAETIRKYALKYMYKNNLSDVYEKLLDECKNSKDYRFDSNFMKNLNNKIISLRDKEEHYLDIINRLTKIYVN